MGLRRHPILEIFYYSPSRRHSLLHSLTSFNCILPYFIAPSFVIDAYLNSTSTISQLPQSKIISFEITSIEVSRPFSPCKKFLSPIGAQPHCTLHLCAGNGPGHFSLGFRTNIQWTR